MSSGAAVIRYDGKRGIVWRIKWTDADGKQVQETVGAERDGVTRKKAEIELRERLTRVDKKGYRRPKRVTFTDYSETWFSEGQTRRAWKPKTVRAYRNALDRLEPSFGHLPLAAIRPRDIAAHVKTALDTHAPATVNLDVTVLGDVLKSAKREELIDSNPAEGVERPKIVRRRSRILEPAEVGKVLKAFTDEQARTIFLTLALTGIRRFELQALLWRDVDLVDSVLRVQVSQSEEGERAIALAPLLVEALAHRKNATAFSGDDERVFCHPEIGSKLNPEWYAEQFRAALKTCGITDYVRPFHDARHGALTNMAATGQVSPIALMATAGHRSMATTNRYVHLAGVVFRDEADALAQRYNFVPDSGDLSEPEHTESGSRTANHDE
jgi:integrase